jgi:hypothetical protein
MLDIFTEFEPTNYLDCALQNCQSCSSCPSTLGLQTPSGLELRVEVVVDKLGKGNLEGGAAEIAVVVAIDGVGLRLQTIYAAPKQVARCQETRTVLPKLDLCVEAG